MHSCSSIGSALSKRMRSGVSGLLTSLGSTIFEYLVERVIAVVNMHRSQVNMHRRQIRIHSSHTHSMVAIKFPKIETASSIIYIDL